MPEKISVRDKFALFNDHWRPKVIGELNGQELKVVKCQGVFPWHSHETEDEFFLCWKGLFRIEFRDQIVELGPGEGLVVPHGVEHRTAADEEAEVLLIEPAATRNTGDAKESVIYTAPNGIRV